MSRFGVMKHLNVLEEAGLVVTRRRGREKLHYLNAVPIRLIYERWVSKYSEGTAASLINLKSDLEKTMEKVYEIYIRTTPQKLWEALTDPAMQTKYNFGQVFSGELQPGAHYELTDPRSRAPIGDGEIIEADPPHRLVQTMRVLFDEAAKSEGFSRLTWEIEQVEDSCRLVLTHDQMREGADSHLYGGWPMILSGLKTWLETGTVLTTPGSLQYS